MSRNLRHSESEGSVSFAFLVFCRFSIHFWIVGSLPLPWPIRMKIALGAAKGLAFLHEEAERPVIYRDFKTSNILLDAVSSRLIVNMSF